MSNRDEIAQHLHEAFPLGGDYVTRPELAVIVDVFETKITLSESRQRNWVLGGCLAVIVTFGGGYVSMATKLDRLNEAMPVINQILDGRNRWMQHDNRRDNRQDEKLKALDPAYEPIPYMETPR